MGENYNKAFALPYMIWVPVEGFEHLYDVSTLGQVRSHHTGKLLKPITINGYQYVNLHNKGKMKREYVHRLVAKERPITDSSGDTSDKTSKTDKH